MEQFKRKFFEEASDLLQELEYSLLKLENDPSDKSMVEQVFRCMHTIKGNSAMFGFTQIDRFTHNLETVYDKVRNGKLAVTSALLTLTLEAVDHLKTLLECGDEVDNATSVRSDMLVNRLFEITGTEVSANHSRSTAPSEKGELSSYFIRFTPHNDLLKKGNNPLYIIDDLCLLGDAKVFADTSKIPPLDQLDPTCCYTSWQIVLATNESQQAIKDVFLFVEDDCNLEIDAVASENILANSEIASRLELEFASRGALNLATVRQLYDSCTTQAATTRSSAKDSSAPTIRVASDKVDGLMNQISELIIIQAQLTLLAETSNLPELAAVAESMEKLSRRLRDTAFSISLIPLDSLLTRFHRLVRDVSKDLGKDAILITEGTDTELDKTMIESISDPIMHILRNCLDHGIEQEAERIRKGKPKQSSITLKAFYSGAYVHIQISDDGKGVDLEQVQQKGVEMGLVATDKSASKQELLSLLFVPGFSTARKVTELSGRGVGMDVVKKKITELRGEVEIDSEKDKGATITIRLPLTLSIVDGLLARIGDTLFLIPLSAVETIVAVSQKDIKGANSLIPHSGKLIPYVNLSEVFGIANSNDQLLQMVVVRYNNVLVGLVIDRIVGEHQAVLKPLGRAFRNLDMVSGATILGDGSIALVLDPARVVYRASAAS